MRKKGKRKKGVKVDLKWLKTYKHLYRDISCGNESRIQNQSLKTTPKKTSSYVRCVMIFFHGIGTVKENVS